MNTKPTLVSAATIACLKEGSTLKVSPPYLVTPSAAELAERKHVTIEVVPESVTPPTTQDARPTAEGDLTLAAHIDSTLLSADATPDQIQALCREAATHGFAAVCVNPCYVELAVSELSDTGPAVATVCGFPLGANVSSIKAAEAHLAETQGAREIDMVLPLGWLKANDWSAVRDDVASVREALKEQSSLLKVIIETPLLTDEQKVVASIVSVEAGADYVKTGTGHSGPATAADVTLIRRAIGDRARIKAAGGIRDRRTARELVDAGADRLGTSHALALLP